MKLTNKQIKQIISEELRNVLNEVRNPMLDLVDNILKATNSASYQTIMSAFKRNALILHNERSILGDYKGSHRKQLVDNLADAMYEYQESRGMSGLERLINAAQDIRFEYQGYDEKDLDSEEEPPF